MLMKILVYNALCSFSLFYETTAMNISVNFLISYFQSYDIGSVTLLICVDEGIKTNILLEMSKHGLISSFSFATLEDRPLVRAGGVLDITCDMSSAFLEEITKEKMFGVHTEWLLLDEVESVGRLELTEGVKKLEGVYALPGSCVTLAQMAGDEVAFYEVYRISLYKPLIYIHMARSSLNTFSKLPPRQDRTNFQAITLNSATAFYHFEVFRGFGSLDRPEVDTIPKLNYLVIVHLAEQLNFSFTRNIVYDYGWQTNGTFSGLMGMIQRQEIDFGATGIFMRPDRIPIVDFTGDTFQIKAHLIFRQPSLSSVSNIFLLPFTGLVWVCCFALAVITAVILCGELMVATRLGLHYPFETRITLPDIVTIVIGCVCQQGPGKSPKSQLARIAIFAFSLCALFFYTSYSANIVALLQSTSPTLKTLSDIAKSPLAVGVQDVIYNKIFFQEAIDKDVRELYEKKVAPVGDKAYMRPEEGIRRVRTDLFAFSIEAHWGYKLISDTFVESEKCALGEVRLFLLQKLSIPVVKKSGYREHFTQRICWQRDVGIHSRLRQKWLPEKPDCGSSDKSYVSVGLTDFKPALLVFSYGVLLSLFFLIFEIIYKIRKTILKPCYERRVHNQ